VITGEPCSTHVRCERGCTARTAWFHAAQQSSRRQQSLQELKYQGWLTHRAESHQAVLEQAREVLLQRVPGLPTPALLALLEASFPFVGIPELRGVPLAVSSLAQFSPG
jgi:hypothetical protein